jgi:hypothetical protein
VHFSATVATGGAVDSGPHPPSGLKDALVDLARLQTAPSLQELAKPGVFLLLPPGELTYLDEVEGHTFL